MRSRVITEEAVERALLSLFIAADGAQLRREEKKKVVEVRALLHELDRHRKDGLLVDAAAGKAYVGLLAASLLGFRRISVIEREPKRIEACKAAAQRMRAEVSLDVVEGDVADLSAFPASPELLVALHACGNASDSILDAAIHKRAKWLYLVPCCYGESVPFRAQAEAKAEALGLDRHAEIRRRFVMAMIDAERTSRLECAGYDVTVLPFVAPTVTPHNLLIRARRVGEPLRMQRAQEERERLLSS